MIHGTRRGALSTPQRKLVQDNLGLVAVHLRRYVSNLAQPRRDREWEDLFQEGCLGLVNAAERFDPDRGIPFAAFALPRIHNAVSRALYTRFTTIRSPLSRTRSQRDAVRSNAAKDDTPRVPKTVGMSTLVERNLCGPGGRESSEPRKDTIGQRLRTKYEDAVRRAARFVGDQPSTRGDRAELVDRILDERLLIPQAETRHTLRRLARDTQSSYARVAQCEKQIKDLVRTALRADPEFVALEQLAREQRHGCESLFDDAAAQRLQSASMHEFMRRYQRADRTNRARMLHDVLRLSQAHTARILSTCFSRLSPRVRARVLKDTAALATAPEGQDESTDKGRSAHDGTGAPWLAQRRL